MNRRRLFQSAAAAGIVLATHDIAAAAEAIERLAPPMRRYWFLDRTMARPRTMTLTIIDHSLSDGGPFSTWAPKTCTIGRGVWRVSGYHETDRPEIRIYDLEFERGAPAPSGEHTIGPIAGPIIRTSVSPTGHRSVGGVLVPDALNRARCSIHADSV